MRFTMRVLMALSMVAVSLGFAGTALASTGAIARAARPDAGGGFSISLSASSTLALVGTSVTVTATTNPDVGPTPYYTTVYDVTSQTDLIVCGSGTVCSATVTEDTGGTQEFQAYVGDYPEPGNPPGFIIVSSNTVSVFWWQLIIRGF